MRVDEPNQCYNMTNRQGKEMRRPHVQAKTACKKLHMWVCNNVCNGGAQIIVFVNEITEGNISLQDKLQRHHNNKEIFPHSLNKLNIIYY